MGGKGGSGGKRCQQQCGLGCHTATFSVPCLQSMYVRVKREKLVSSPAQYFVWQRLA